MPSEVEPFLCIKLVKIWPVDPDTYIKLLYFGDPFFRICKGKFSPFIEECRRAKLACPQFYHLLFQEIVARVLPVPVDATTSLLPPPFPACPRTFLGHLACRIGVGRASVVDDTSSTK